MEKQTEHKRCMYCGEVKTDVRKTVDPYLWELTGVEEYITICDNCLAIRCMEV